MAMAQAAGGNTFCSHSPLMTAAFHWNNGIVGEMGDEWERQTDSAASPQLRASFLEHIRVTINLPVLRIKCKIHLLQS